jgi:glutamate dehydrogenase
VHFGIGERPGLEKLRQQIELLPADSHWQTLAKVALTGDLNDLHNSIALDAVRGHPGTAPRSSSRGRRATQAASRRAKRLLAELAEAANPIWRCCRWALRETAQPGMTLASGQAHQLPCIGKTYQ